jgi:hypothetical protein
MANLVAQILCCRLFSLGFRILSMIGPTRARFFALMGKHLHADTVKGLWAKAWAQMIPHE